MCVLNCVDFSVMLLYILLCIEIVLRAAIEIRERRLTQLRGGVFAVLRLIPLINDIVPFQKIVGNRKRVCSWKSTKKAIVFCAIRFCVT